MYTWYVNHDWESGMQKLKPVLKRLGDTQGPENPTVTRPRKPCGWPSLDVQDARDNSVAPVAARLAEALQERAALALLVPDLSDGLLAQRSGLSGR